MYSFAKLLSYLGFLKQQTRQQQEDDNEYRIALEFTFITVSIYFVKINDNNITR